nr:RNA-directed DNA polymerase, eukaryota, reverse transcriptase zinc-binding domain protein [Tanacetum cinerariifolium]
MGSYRTKEDDVSRISTSIFVTNFPNSFSARDLFHLCKKYGHVVDTFIPLKRLKDGKRFGFVCFINVFNVERLVSNLCTIWVDKFKFQSNIARFRRAPLNGNKAPKKKEVGFKRGGNNASGKEGENIDKGKSYVNVAKGHNTSGTTESESIPEIVLDDECLYFKDLSNSLLGRVKNIASLTNLKSALSMKEETCFPSKRLCLFTKLRLNIFENFKIVFRGKAFWIRAKEVPGWVPEFLEDSDDEAQSEEGFQGGEPVIQDKESCGEDSDIVEVAGTLFDDSNGTKEKYSEDPFGIYSRLNKNKKDIPVDVNEEFNSLKYPSGFTPNGETKESNSNAKSAKKINNDREQNCTIEETQNGKDGKSTCKGSKNNVSESVCSGRFKESVVPRTGRSILCLMEELVKVGQTMGYNMEGCVKDVTEIIESQGADSVGNSGGILCVWDPNSFRKSSITVSDYFAIIQGVWIKNGVNLLIVVVRYKSDRFGSTFDSHGSFIANVGLEGVHLGGSAYTWCHKSATKMSKLDRNLSDHRPILLRESVFDYGLVPFHFYHHWLELDGFNKHVIDSWKAAPGDMSNDEAIDSGKGFGEVVSRGMEVHYSLQHAHKIQATEVAQKAKINWSVEGDENSRFFHGMLNKKRSQLSIRCVMADGVWIDKLDDVKVEQQEDLERNVSKEEIKRAIWDCGTDKSPGPDGFSFGFYRLFWSTMEHDVCEAVNYFFTYGVIPKGCNSSFIDLILKVPDANMVKDFRPISLIGSLYKIIAKILANRLVSVLGDILKDVQSAFIAERQILDGSFILNEVMQWCTSKKKQALIFKVDFEKAYDSRVVDAGMFTGIKLNNSLNLSDLFNADDVMFVGQWCDGNIDVLVHVLECFYRASGLRINMRKSKIMGIHVEDVKVKHMASKLGCLILNTPFLHLGTKFGGSMSRVQEWKELVDKVLSRISKWKMKALSIGGRLTLLKSVLGSMPIFHISILCVPSSVLHTLESIRSHFFNGHDLKSKKASWVKWSSVLAAKNKGGLGVSSLYALNRGLMIKWVWRFYSQKSSLWVRVVKAIHGDDGKMDQGVNVFEFMRLKLGNEDSTLFWEDNWINGFVLKDMYPRIYALEKSKIVKVSSRLMESSLDYSFHRNVRGGVEQSQYDALSDLVNGITLVPASNRYVWSMESSGEFSVASIRKVVDDNRLPKVSSVTRWVKFVPINVNVLAWKVKLDALPTRLNISRRGVFYVSWWCIWSYRNKLLFETKVPSKAMLFDDVVSSHWCRFRCKVSFSWDVWLKNPYLIVV